MPDSCGTAPLRDQPQAEGDGDGVVPVAGAELFLDAVHVPVDRMAGNAEDPADIVLGHALRKQAQRLHFPARQLDIDDG